MIEGTPETPYHIPHTVVETSMFTRACALSGIDDQERNRIVSLVAMNPSAGDPIPGTGGCRKVRIVGRGKGKSGGYRTITFWSGERYPVFLLTAYSKGMKEDLERSKIRELASTARILLDGYR